MLLIQEPAKIVSLFYCYANEDKTFQAQLRAHLGQLIRQKLLTDWGPDDLGAGQTKEEEISKHLNTAHIILFLVSSDFINSNYCINTKERALVRYQKKEARIIPILVRQVDVTNDLFSGIELLRVENKSVAAWGDNSDEAYTQIATKIRTVTYEILGRKHISEAPSETPLAEQINPYRGLKPYTEQDARFFFGRNTCIFDLMQKLVEDKRLLVVLGPTGSGKTSILQAGVIPLLREGRTLTRSATWEILLFTPGEHATSQFLSLLGAPNAQDVREAIKIWQQQHPKNERVVIIIDPFEELFKLATPEEQQKFLKQCLKIIIYDLATIIIGMNDTYYGDLAEFADFIALAEPQMSNIPALKPEEIREIIEKPADLVSLYFGEYLVERVIADTMKSTKEPERRHRHSSVLPLLSIDLEQLYEKRRDHLVTLDDYLSLGPFSESLTFFANTAFNALDEQQQVLARRILIDLVALGDESEGRPDTRRQRLLTSFCCTQDERKAVQAVVEKLAKAHLLEAQWSQQKKDLEVTLINESLLREWGLLKDWLREDRQFLLWYQEFERHLQKWLSSSAILSQRDTTCLLHGRMLLEANLWLKESPQRFLGEAQDFVLVSSALREQEEQQAKAIQEMQAQQHIALAKQLATRTLLLQERTPRSLRTSLLLAVEALRRHHGVEADQALRQGLALLPRFLSRVNMGTGKTLLFSADGCSLAAAGTAGVSWVYHIQSEEEHTVTLSLGETRAIALSAHGEYLLAGTYAGVAWLIDTRNVCRVAMMKYSAHIHSVALTQKDPYTVALGYADGTIKLYQFVERDEPVLPLPETILEQRATFLYECSHGNSLSFLSLSHNEHYLLSGGADHIVRVWNKDDGLCIAAHDFESPISSALFSPDDSTIAVLSTTGTAFVWPWQQKSRQVWQKKKGQVVSIPQAEKIQAFTFSPDGKCLAIGSLDTFARIWNLQNMQAGVPFPHTSAVLSLCYHQSEDWFVTASKDGDVRVYTLSDGALRQSIPHHTSTLTVVVSPQKPYLATIDDQERVWIWQVHDGTLPVRFPYSGKVAYLAFDQKSGKDLLHFAVKEAALLKMHTLSLDSSLINTVYEFQYAPVWLASNDKRHFTIPDSTVKLYAVSFDGRYYATATPDGNIQVIGVKGYYDKNTNHVRGTITALVFSHSGEYLAIVTTEGSLFFWKWREKDLVPMPLPQGASPQAALFSKDDDYLVVVVNKHEVSTWYWQRPAEKPEVTFRQDSPIHTITLCPNTPYLLTTSQEKNVSIWDISTGLLVQSLSKREVVAAAFDTEGNYLAIASSDYTVGIWNVSTGEQLTSLTHSDRVYAAAFSKDSRYLATVCDDAMIRIWLWKQDDLEAEARLRLTSNLTPEEWQEYLKNEPYQETFPNLGWRELS